LFFQFLSATIFAENPRLIRAFILDDVGSKRTFNLDRSSLTSLPAALQPV